MRTHTHTQAKLKLSQGKGCKCKMRCKCRGSHYFDVEKKEQQQADPVVMVTPANTRTKIRVPYYTTISRFFTQNIFFASKSSLT